MSENSTQNKSKAPLIATIVVAVLALAAVIALIIVLSLPKGDEQPSGNSGFTVTKEFEQECQYAAHDLISQSFEVMRLFVFDGLSYNGEPYGNEPEDGLFTVATEYNSKYTTLEDIENLVRSTYTGGAVETVLHNVDGHAHTIYQNRTVLVEAVYEDEPAQGESRPMYVEKEVLGISAEFVPNPSKKELWANCSIKIVPTSETTCELTVYLGGVDENTDLSAVDPNHVVELEMIKTADGWRLTEFVC